MRYKALVVDVDGTLLCPERQWITPPCLLALQALQRRGIPVIISTGRGAFAAGPKVLSGLLPDYKICSNGAWVLDKNDSILFAYRFTKGQVETLTSYCERNDYRLTFAFEDGYYVYIDFEGYKEHYRATSGDPSQIKDGTARVRHLESLPFSAHAFFPPEKSSSLAKLGCGLKTMEFRPGIYDVCRDEISKAVGLAHLLDYLALGWEEIVAVGDGINDLEMIAQAGVGVAMGNAGDALKNAADLVTGSVLEDGILEPIARFFP